jgi:AbrB family looped-hinge helix DNA binding protein
MMPLTKVTRNGQVTIPAEMRREVGIEEGDLIELQVVGDHLILVPKKLIDKNQAYFWTPEWQAAEREAQADIDEGRVKEFASVEELLNELHSES